MKSGNEYLAWFGEPVPKEEVLEAVHRNETTPAYWHRYSKKQIDVVFSLCTELRDAYGISAIFGHEEISPKRKIDPGPAFPLDQLRDRVILRDRPEEGEEEEEAPSLAKQGVVTASKLNLRSGPTVTTDTVASPFLKGTPIEIRRELNGWYEVDVRGWVKKEYVRT